MVAKTGEAAGWFRPGGFSFTNRSSARFSGSRLLCQWEVCEIPEIIADSSLASPSIGRGASQRQP
jgi:hypothetical protein